MRPGLSRPDESGLEHKPIGTWKRLLKNGKLPDRRRGGGKRNRRPEEV